MKRFFILLAITVLIMVQFSCNYSPQEALLDIDEKTEFGDVLVDQVSGYKGVFIREKKWYGTLCLNTYLNVTVSDNKNFMLDTSGTAKYLDGDDDFTSFLILFNPKSAGDFTAAVFINTKERTYKHYLYGRGI